MARTKGSLNRPKRRLLALLQENFPDYHPVLEMAKIANDMGNSVELRANMHKEVAQYVEPKRKAIEMDANVDLNGDLSITLIKAKVVNGPGNT